jgi:hypothetical protein
MKSHRKISLTTALLAALVAVVPSCASANSLLSGYGGPGAGNQAILGSALIGGGGSAGGGGSSGSSGSGSTGSTGSAAGSAAGSEAVGGGEAAPADSSGRGTREGGAAGKGAAGEAAGGAAGSRRGHGKASGGAARAYPVRSLDDASKPTSAGAGALGFSAADFGYLILVVALLGATGLVTRGLARAPTPIGSPAATGKGP